MGIDGFSSSTVEQTGTDSDCQSGLAVGTTPGPSLTPTLVLFPISSVPISAGDVISAEVKYSAGKFTLTLKDLTTSKSFSKTGTVSGAARNSAEWIAEAPSSSSGVLPLAPFGTVHFGKDATSVTGTCKATISGSTHFIGGFGTLYKITMITHTGSLVKASVSALSTDHSSFSATWHRAGPLIRATAARSPALAVP